MRRALFIVDLQRDFCKGGALGIPTADHIVPIINSLLPYYEWVLASKDWHPEDSIHFKHWPPHCIASSPGAEFHPGLEATHLKYVFLKGTENKDDGYSAFEATNRSLKEYLSSHGITDIDLCGLATDYCVKATALDALKEGFRVRIITDAIDAVNLHPNDGPSALKAMSDAGAILIESRLMLSHAPSTPL
jgi:nicotinamidase/pyrazinamidase